jgi:phosphatidate cytidylyltransferase
MLRQRVITALLMVAVFIPALFHPEPTGLAALSLVLIVAGGWEWGRLVGMSHAGALGLAAATLVACLLSWHHDLQNAPLGSVWLALSLAWVLGAIWMLRQGNSKWNLMPQGARALLGLLVLWATWLALFAAKLVGTNFILSILLLVWVADITAYFSGRAWGRRKLAPSISPGKTWEGVAGAVFGVLLLSAMWIKLDAGQPDWTPSLYTRLMTMGVAWGVLAVLGLTAMSVVGDLVESLIKRCAGVKDSSRLLPGHGGVLDRVDALLPTLPLALCFYSWVRA